MSTPLFSRAIPWPAAAPRPRWAGPVRVVAVVALCTGISALMAPHLDVANIIMVYLAGVVYVALREGPGVSVATVVGSIFLFDLIFVEPRWGLNPLNPKHFFTFAVMLAVGLLISRLADRARHQARAAEAERLRNTLLSGISHDFRTPLTTIIGAATSLVEQSGRLDAAQRTRLAQSVQHEALRLHERVSGLLDLTRLEEGAVQLDAQWCPADDLVNEALGARSGRLGSHAVVLDVPPEAIVWCDPRLVEQALGNIVDNALRYTPAGSTIRIAVRADEGTWSLAVSDNGPGLAPGSEQDVFRKFYRGRGEPAGAGFGLGLAICAAVARLHQGKIVAASPGGACFTLTLPQPPRQPPPAADTP